MALTISDIAQLAGVSRATVSGVLNGSSTVSEKTKKKVLAIIEKHNYRPNEVARALALRHTGLIGLIIRDISNPLFSKIALGVEEVCIRRGYSVIIGNTRKEPEREITNINLLRRRRVDGLIIIPMQNVPDLSHIWELKREKYPFVLLSQVPGIEADVVRCDDEQGAFIATQHLIGLHRSRIVYVTGPETAIADNRRLRGYQRALIKNNLVPKDEWVVSGGYRLMHGYQAGKRIVSEFDPLPDSIFCYNDSVAVGLIRALSESHVRVPEDVAVIGFDDSGASAYLETALTTVAQPAQEIGRKAAEMVLERIEKKTVDRPVDSVLLEAKLMIRETCGANAKGTVQPLE